MSPADRWAFCYLPLLKASFFLQARFFLLSVLSSF